VDHTKIHAIDVMNQRELYDALGQAWYDQCRPKTGEAYFIESAAKVGKREFDNLLPQLREDLRQPHFYGVAACVAGTIRRCGTWPMPADVVASLMVQLGFGLLDQLITRILDGNGDAPYDEDRAFVFLPVVSQFPNSTVTPAASNTYRAQALTSEYEITPKARSSAVILLFNTKQKQDDDRALA
jgi:hypothetical protein